MAERVGFEPNSKRNFNELRGQVRVRKYGTESYDIAIAPLLLPQRTQVLGSIPEWHGWHAFRRGLATNLHALGVDDKTIQAILRHSNVGVTMNIYVKSVSESQVSAMDALGEKLGTCNDLATEENEGEAIEPQTRVLQ